MNFTVAYDTDAEDDLADLWMAGPGFLAITRASAAIDRILATNPTQGQYLAEGLWRLIVPPLAVHHTVDTPRRHVQVSRTA